MIYINNPRLVLLLLKSVEIINKRIISTRLIQAMIDPIIESQFLKEGGNFMIIIL
jgi:hypothetical protein